MSLIPWNPFNDLGGFFDEQDWLMPLGRQTKKACPAMDIYETDKEVIAEVNLPGVDPEKIDITVEGQVLRISGAKEEKTEEKKKNYWRQEIRKGFFERMARLPSPVNEDKIEANYQNGILKIVMPKTDKGAKTKKIRVKTANK